MNQLTKGSKVKIYLMNDNIPEVDGEFEGFLNLGEDSAILIKSCNDKKKKYKIIPVVAIAYLEVTELSEEKEEDESNKNVTYFA
ncbi:MAG: hypothetical protein ACP5GR_00170 [Thermoplasmata archaeon]